MGNLLSSMAAAVRRSNTEDSHVYRGGSSGGEGANAEMASSSSSSSTAVTSPFDALPDELVLKIIKMAATWMDGNDQRYDHNWLVDVLRKVSPRFKQLATDRSLWEGYVWISADMNPEKFEFVVQKCLHSKTTDLAGT